MTTEEKIIDFFARRRVKINLAHAQYLVRLVRNEIEDNWYRLEKYHWNPGKQSYELIHTGFIDPEKFDAIIARGIRRVEHFYMYRVTLPNGDFQEFYTVRDSII